MYVFLSQSLSGIHFRSNHERLLDEVSRAITIISYGLELFVRDHLVMQSTNKSSLLATTSTKPITNANEFLDNNTNQHVDFRHFSEQHQPFVASQQLDQHNYPSVHPLLNLSDIDIRSHSSCKGALSEKALKKGNTLYE